MEKKHPLTKEVQISNPFEVVDLPFVVTLLNIGYHKYRRRWTKRLFKRLGRLIFDVAYHWLKISGQGKFHYHRDGNVSELLFNGRNGQFGGIYHYPRDHIFEAPTAALQAVLLPSDGVFFDVGANWGCLSLQASALPGFRGQIHAFEPVPGTYEDLTHIVKQAGLEDMIHCNGIGLSDFTGSGTMVLPDGGAQSGWATITDSPQQGSFEVRLERLDDLNLPAPDLIKIDAEGHEINVLKGAESILRRHKPGVVFENWLETESVTTTIQPLMFFEELGYSLYFPAWRDGPCPDDAISLGNMPSSNARGKFVTLIPIQWEHRMFGPQHWSYLAWHKDRETELLGLFSSDSAGEKEIGERT